MSPSQLFASSAAVAALPAGLLIVQAGAHGSDLGRLDLTIDQGRTQLSDIPPAADRREVPGQDQYEMVQAWIARRGPVDAPRTDRIGRAERGLSHGEER